MTNEEFVAAVTARLEAIGATEIDVRADHMIGVNCTIRGKRWMMITAIDCKADGTFAPIYLSENGGPASRQLSFAGVAQSCDDIAAGKYETLGESS